MKKALLAVAAAATTILALAAPAHAMGSGDGYVDMQTGVTYTVYEPTYTNGLPQVQFGGAIVAANCSAEQVTFAKYAKGKRAFTITEGNPICQDIGVGPQVFTTTVAGATAVVTAYCPPGARNCSMKSVSTYGGNLQVILPAANSLLRPTQVWIETLRGQSIGGNELVKIAQSMSAVANTNNSGNQGWNGNGNQGWGGGGNSQNQGFSG